MFSSWINIQDSANEQFRENELSLRTYNDVLNDKIGYNDLRFIANNYKIGDG